MLLTQYLAQQPHIAKASGVSEDVVKKVQSILGWPATREQVHEAMQYVPDDFVLKISATGTPDEARAKVQEYIDRGCTCPILYPMSDPYLMIDTFSPTPSALKAACARVLPDTGFSPEARCLWLAAAWLYACVRSGSKNQCPVPG